MTFLLRLMQEVLAQSQGDLMDKKEVVVAAVDHFVMKIPNNKVGLVIGKGGDTIKQMQARTHARIQVIPLHLPPGYATTDRNVHIDGMSDQIEAAKQLINEVISEVCYLVFVYARARVRYYYIIVLSNGVFSE